ncbi:MAG: hypothetical protein JNG90_06085, partial [Planctomycetaceae bacterium]|nr:hypothetical protein [Planctomycetaceae bacterium]
SRPACALPPARSHGALGCLGALFTLFVACAILFVGFRLGGLRSLGLAMAVAVVLMLLVRRRAPIVGALGILVVVGVTLVGVLLMSIPFAARHVDEHDLRWVDDFLDGPAARFSPTYRVRLEQARAQALAERARVKAEFDRWKLSSQHFDEHGFAPFERGAFRPDSAREVHPAPAGAKLHIELKPNALAQRNISPDSLAATFLAIVDLIGAGETSDADGPLTLASLDQMEIRARHGDALPLNQIARLRKESRRGDAPRIVALIVSAGKKSRVIDPPELRQVFEYLHGIEAERAKSRGGQLFQVVLSDSELVIEIENQEPDGIPVEAALAANKPQQPTQRRAGGEAQRHLMAAEAQRLQVARIEQRDADRAARSLPPAQPPVQSPSAAPAAATPSSPPASPAPKRAPGKPPEEGTWADLLIAYHLMMWSLPESLGGAAETQVVSDPLVTAAPHGADETEVVVTPEGTTVVAVNQPVDLPEVPSTPTAPAAPPAPPAVPIPATPRAAAPPPLPAQTAPAAPAAATREAPAATPTAAADGLADAVRPDWLIEKPEYLDGQGVFHMRRSTGRLYDSPDESHEAAAELLLEMTRDYATRLLGAEAARQVSIPMHTILTDFVAATYDEQGPPPGLPDDDAWETHLLLKFDAADQRLIERSWRQSVVEHNLRYAGAGAALVLALLGTLFGYLKIDTATRGYYSGRLKLATGALVAAITTLGILLAVGTLRL